MTDVMMTQEEDRDKLAHLSSLGTIVMECARETNHAFTAVKNIGQRGLSNVEEAMSSSVSGALAHKGTKNGPINKTWHAGLEEISDTKLPSGYGPKEFQEFTNGLENGMPHMKLENQGGSNWAERKIKEV